MGIKVFSVLLVIFHSFALYRMEILENSITKQSANITTQTPTKSRTLYDYQTHAVAFKDLIESKCIIEILNGSESFITKWHNNGRKGSISVTFLHKELLSKHQIWRLAGERITDFCRGFPTYLIKSPDDVSQNTLDELNNVIDKNRDRRSIRRIKRQLQLRYLKNQLGSDIDKFPNFPIIHLFQNLYNTRTMNRF